MLYCVHCVGVGVGVLDCFKGIVGITHESH